MTSARQMGAQTCSTHKLLVRVWGWARVMVEFGTSSAFRGMGKWVRLYRSLGYAFGVHLTRCLRTLRARAKGRALVRATFGVRGRKVKSPDCALAQASDCDIL